MFGQNRITPLTDGTRNRSFDVKCCVSFDERIAVRFVPTDEDGIRREQH